MRSASGPLSSAVATLQPGDVVADRYQIESLLGAGGMGVVLAARDLTTQAQVALKLLRPSGQMTAMEEARESTRRERLVARLLREARATAQIQSEHAARIFDVGTLPDGDPYIVMEMLEGTDLEQLVRKRGALPADEAVEYVLQACDAIQDAHARGIIHRDLKPANIS